MKLIPAGGELPAGRTGRGIRRGLAAASVLLTGAALLLPGARNGLAYLLNRVMERSEQVNAYVYQRFSADPGENGVLGGLLAGAAIACLLGAGMLRCRRITALCAAAAAAGAQIWLGLSLPPAVNILIFTLAGILAAEKLSLRKTACIALAAALTAGMTALAWPGTNPAVEAASERVRDLLEPAGTAPSSGSPEEIPGAVRETRHTDVRARAPGDETAEPEAQYRLVTLEEEHISRPEWIDYLKIALLLAAATGAVVLPFMPAAALNRRRRKAREKRAAFDSPDRGEALCAMFRHTARYLEATGHGAGNLPFRAWPASLRGNMPEKYVDSFEKCCILFEEAAYSGHEITEAQTAQVRELLAETERLVYDRAGWRERLRLRYAECLHE